MVPLELGWYFGDTPKEPHFPIIPVLYPAALKVSAMIVSLKGSPPITSSGIRFGNPVLTHILPVNIDPRDGTHTDPGE